MSNNIPNFIEVYNNALDDRACIEIIDYFKHVIELGFTKDRQSTQGAGKLEIEDQAFFEPTDSFNCQHIKPELMEKVNHAIWENGLTPYIQKYSILERGQIGVYTLKLQRTLPGQGYHVWHCENMNREHSFRVLTWTLYLNDDFEAGETEFLYQQYRYKPKRGDLVLFPAAFTHVHRGNMPIGNTKYIITGWVEY